MNREIGALAPENDMYRNWCDAVKLPRELLEPISGAFQIRIMDALCTSQPACDMWNEVGQHELAAELGLDDAQRVLIIDHANRAVHEFLLQADYIDQDLLDEAR